MGLVTLLWWMVLYPVSAAAGAAVGYLVYLLFVVIPGLLGAPTGLFHLIGTLVGLASAGGTFVRTAGRLAPEAPRGVAAAACGITIAGVAWWVRDRHALAALTIAVPMVLGAVGGVLATHARLRQTRPRATAPDQRGAPSPQNPA